SDLVTSVIAHDGDSGRHPGARRGLTAGMARHMPGCRVMWGGIRPTQGALVAGLRAGIGTAFFPVAPGPAPPLLPRLINVQSNFDVRRLYAGGQVAPVRRTSPRTPPFLGAADAVIGPMLPAGSPPLPPPDPRRRGSFPRRPENSGAPITNWSHAPRRRPGEPGWNGVERQG